MGTGLDHAFIVHFDKLICVMCSNVCSMFVIMCYKFRELYAW